MSWSLLGKLGLRLLHVVAVLALTVPPIAHGEPASAIPQASRKMAWREPVVLQAAATAMPTDEGLPEPSQTPPAPNPHSAALMFVENEGQYSAPASAENALPRFQARGSMGTVYLAPDAVWINLLDFRAQGTPLTATIAAPPATSTASATPTPANTTAPTSTPSSAPSATPTNIGQAPTNIGQAETPSQTAAPSDTALPSETPGLEPSPASNPSASPTANPPTESATPTTPTAAGTDARPTATATLDASATTTPDAAAPGSPLPPAATDATLSAPSSATVPADSTLETPPTPPASETPAETESPAPPTETTTATGTATATEIAVTATPSATLEPTATATASPVPSATLAPLPSATQTVPARPTETATAPPATAPALLGDPRRPVGFNNFRLAFTGASPDPQLTGFDRLDSRVSYFVGADASQWHPDVPAWGGVRYRALYPGLDLEISSQDSAWAWRLVVTNPALGLPQLANVAWEVDGADSMVLGNGLLRLRSPAGDSVLPLLRVVEPDGRELDAAALRAAGASDPALVGREVRQPFLALALAGQAAGWPRGELALAPAARMQPPEAADAAPLLDPNPPAQLYGTYLGGDAFAVAADLDGAAYVTGLTFSAEFTYTVGYSQTQHAVADAYVIKVSADGSSLHYLTHLGGDNDDYGRAIAVDSSGAAYITGLTLSTDYPTTSNAYDQTENGGGPLLSKLSPDGTELAYSSYLGTNGHGYGIAVQPWVDDVAHVVGYTDSGDFPVTIDAFMGTRPGDFEIFLSKIDTSQSGSSSLVYSTFLGGGSQDCGSDLSRGCTVAVDRYGYVYVAGATYSDNITTTVSAYDASYNDGGDAFLLKLDTTISGTAGLLYGTYLGGSGYECYGGCAVAVNGNQSAYLAGATASTDFITTTAAYSGTYAGGEYDTFVARIDTLQSGAASLGYSTYLGGPGGDVSLFVAVNAVGEATVSGRTDASGFPTTPDALQPDYNGGDCGFDCRDAFLARLSADGSELLYSTYLGGQSDEFGWGVAVQPYDDSTVLSVGWSEAGDFPVTEGAYYETRLDGFAGFLVKFTVVTCAR